LVVDVTDVADADTMFAIFRRPGRRLRIPEWIPITFAKKQFCVCVLSSVLAMTLGRGPAAMVFSLYEESATSEKEL
jgi:hypothetical protein